MRTLTHFLMLSTQNSPGDHPLAVQLSPIESKNRQFLHLLKHDTS